MALRQELLLRLKEDFQLNIYEVKIWTVLLEKGIATAGELADLSGVPRSRCYDVLESLEKKGFIIMKIGKPIKYLSVQPEEIISRVKKNIEDDTQLSLKMFEEVRSTDVFKDIQLLYSTGIEKVDSTELSTSVIGRDNVLAFMKGLIEQADKSILITTTQDGFSRKLAIINKAMKKSGKKSMKIKLIAPHDEKAIKKSTGKIEFINKDAGSRMIIIDNKELLFMLQDGNNDKDHDCGVWVKSEFFAKAVAALVEHQVR
ncbi:TrmB family transcriptional regulator [Candidatus Woesearchaeota archaeon]|nr:TrmB family transcriptional regulator [Candidatus Woesearchaeota archaeon]